MQISLTGSGLLDKSRLRAWSLEQQDAIRRHLAAAMKASGKDMARQAGEVARRSLKIRRRNFPGMYAKVYDKKPNSLPALLIGSKIPWLGIHEKGGTISGKLLIPFGNVRIGYKRWKALIRNLMAGGNAYFRQVRGRAILFAENIAENDAELGRFKRVIRRSLGGGRLKRGADIPVAVLVTRVTLRKRLGLEKSVRDNLSKLAQAIERSVQGAG
jgi:hypothetical protein